MKRQILITLLILLFVTGFATAATINVPADYSTIQAAINAADDGDEIIVAQGVYYEAIDFTDAAACTVRSTDPYNPDFVDNTIIDATGLEVPVVTFGPIDDPNYELPPDDPNFKALVLDGFKITGGETGFGGGIYCESAPPTIRNCHIVNNRAVDMGMYEGDGGGVYLQSAGARFINCKIMNNHAEWWGGGVFCNESDGEYDDETGLITGAAFINCLIANNDSNDYGGAMYCQASSPIIILSTIINNIGYDADPLDLLDDWEGGIYCVDDSAPEITNCILWNNGNDLFECDATFSCIEDGDGGEGNIDDNPLFVWGPFGDYYLSQLAGLQLADSPCLNAGTGYIRDYIDYEIGLITTCTTNVVDTSFIDMGYHYNYYYGPPLMRELQIFVTGNGTTDPTPAPDVHTYPLHTPVVITAIPDPNHRVKSWNFDPTNFAPTYIVIMDDNKIVTVEFELIYHSTLNVGAGYEYIVIQEAIDDAKDGDTIVIHPGTYPGQAGCIVLGKNITITSTNPDDPNIVAATVVDYAGENRGGFRLYGSGAGSCVLNGITLINSHTGRLTPPHGVDRPAGSRGYDGLPHIGGGGLTLYGNHAVVNCVIRNCSVEGADADYGWDGDDDVPGGDGGDGGDAAGAGIYIGSGSPLIKNCTIDGCIATVGDGGDGANGGDPTSGGDGGVTGRVRGGGVSCAPATSPTFIDCTITNCQAVGGDGGDGGDATGIAGVGGFGGLTYYDPGQGPPEDYSANGAGVYCDVASNVTFIGCTFSNNTTYGSVSGQGGLSAAGIQNQPRQNFNIPSFGAGLYGAFNSSVTLRNCTLQGNLTARYADQYTGYGGGICLEGSAYAELNNCSILNNNAPVGAGAYASAVTDFHVEDCNFLDNSAYIGGGLLSIDNVGNISGCNIIGNSADDPNEAIYGAGGGLFCFSSEALISDCRISNNTASGSGGGVYFAGAPETITPFYGAPTLKNCLVFDNTAGREGGGVSCDSYSEPNIVNCTITGNEALGDPPFDVGYGGGLYCTYESNTNIINSILWGNAGPNTIGPEFAIETSFDSEPRPATLTVTYCDVWGGEQEAWVDEGCTLNWDVDPIDPNYPTNIDADPLFVNGYYLSQTLAGQTDDSQCVNAGKGSPADWGLQSYTTRTDGVPDVCDVDMGYHYPLIIIPVFCDFDFDGDVDLDDLAILSSHWLQQNCGSPGWCEGTDLDFDSDVDFVDYAIFAQAYASFLDVTPPDPNPSGWAIEPYEISPFTISMTAMIATDESGLVEYLFERVSVGGEPNDVNSGWLTEREWEDTVFADETEYCYTVKTRDLYDNETTPSGERCVWIDHTAPQPDRSTWFEPPHPVSSSAIAMTATTAEDPSGGIEYQFECIGGGGHSSGWLDSSEYTDTGLAPSTEYTYKVRTHDMYNNTTDYSIEWYATTLPE